MASIHVTPPLVIAAGSIFPPVCAVITGLRFYCRRRQGSFYGVDDYLTLPALVFLIGLCAATLRGVALHAIAYPTPVAATSTDLTATSSAETTTKRIFVATELLQVLGLGCIKLSAIWYYRRVFGIKKSATFTGCTVAAIFFISAWTGAFFFGLLFQCGYHIDYLDSDLANEQKCSSATSGMQHAFAVTDVVTDLLVLLLPLPMIWHLKATWQEKLRVSAAFVTGILAIIASITRLVIYIEVLDVELSSTPPDPDLLTSAGIYFQLIEHGLALIAVCLPTLSCLFTRRGFDEVIQTQSTDSTPSA